MVLGNVLLGKCGFRHPQGLRCHEQPVHTFTQKQDILRSDSGRNLKTMFPVTEQKTVLCYAWPVYVHITAETSQSLECGSC